MKTASVYQGRSMSQPVLYNLLHDLQDIELKIFNESDEPISMLNFPHEHKYLKVPDVTVSGQTALWATQYRKRRKWKEFLHHELDSSYDLVIGMNELAPPAVAVADNYNIPSLFFIRNLEVSGQEMYQAENNIISNFMKANSGARLQYPFFVKNFKAYEKGMEQADAVVANSEYVSRRLNTDFGVDSEVIYPPIELSDFKVEYHKDGYIGMVNPRNTEKGGDIFMDIVSSMPDEQFLASGVFRDSNLERQCNELDNLTHIGWCDNMREFYKQTRLILVPSRWNEAFGRVAAEAMVSGIPCVVSNRGGLPEIVGDTGVVVDNIESVDAWKEAISKTTENHDPEAQMERAKKFSAERQGRKLADLIESVQ